MLMQTHEARLDALRKELARLGVPEAVATTLVTKTPNDRPVPEGKKGRLPPGLEKFVDWNCRSGTGSEGLDLANSVASVAPTASWPEDDVSQSNAMRTCWRGEVRISFRVPGCRVRNVNLACT